MKYALVYGPEFPFAGARPPVEELGKWKERFDVIEPRAAAAALAATEYDAIVHLHGRYFPRDAWPALTRQLRRGAGLVCLGAGVFENPVDAADNGYSIGARQTAYHRELNISNIFPVAARPGAFEAAEDLRTGAHALSLFDGGEISEFSVRFTHSRDLPHEHGSSGPIEATIEPLVYAVDQAGHRYAAPLVMIGNTKAAFSGGRWIFCNQDAGAAFWANGGADFLCEAAAHAAEGVTEFHLAPNYACYWPHESPTIQCRVQNLGLAGAASAGLRLRVSRSDHTVFALDETLTLDAVMRCHAFPVPLALEPGYYAITAGLTLNGRERVYRSGFFVRDEALMRAGEPLCADGDYFTRGSEVFPVNGMTYMASDVHRKFLFTPNVDTWMRDFRFMRDAGINLVRTGTWTSFRNVMYVDGAPCEEVLRALDAFVSVAKLHGIELIFNFFAFTPEMWEGVNPYLDPLSVAAQKRYISAIVSRYRDVPGISWDLINEPSACNPKKPFQGPQPNGDKYELATWRAWLEARYGTPEALQSALNMTASEAATFDQVPLPEPWDFNLVQIADDIPQPPKERVRALLAKDYAFFANAVFDGWAKDLAAEIRKLAPGHLVAVGQDHATDGRRPHPLFHGRFLDYTSVHTWWQLDDIVWDAAMVKIPGKPAIVQETGTMYVESGRESAFRTEAEVRDILERKLAYAWGAGAAGAIPWLLNTNIYMNDEDEIHIGMLRPDLTEKPEFEAMRGMYGFIDAIRDKMLPAIPHDTYVVFPFDSSYSNFAFPNIATRKAARILSHTLKAPFCGCGDVQLDLLVNPKHILFPSPGVISRASWDSLLRHAENGAAVAVTGPIDVDENWIPVDRSGPLFGAVSGSMPVAREELVRIDEIPLRAVYHSQLIGWVRKSVADGQIARVHTVSRGKGKICWCPLPLEMNREDEPVAAFYRTLLGAPKSCSGPGVFVREIPLKGDGRLYVLVSESGADEAVTLADEKTGARHSILVPAQRSAMIATDGKEIIARYGA